MSWSDITPKNSPKPTQLLAGDIASSLSHAHCGRLDAHGETIVVENNHGCYTQSPIEYLQQYAPSKLKALLNGTTDFTRLSCLSLVIADREGIPDNVEDAGNYIHTQIEPLIQKSLEAYGVEASVTLCTYIEDTETRDFAGGRYVLHVVTTEPNRQRLQDMSTAIQSQLAHFEKGSRGIA